MSVRIIKRGLLDTIQDNGRYGYQHLGINPGGVMDRIAASVANILAGNEMNETVIEMHFPAASFLFESNALISLSGADFGAMINKQPVPINTWMRVSKNSVLEFTSYKNGARCYLAVRGGWQAEKWLNSYSTNLKIKVGGNNGTFLKKDDVFGFVKHQRVSVKTTHPAFEISNLFVSTSNFYSQAAIRCIKGNAFDYLTDDSKHRLSSSFFIITPQSDRMGFRLQGDTLTRTVGNETLSSAVTRGTVQLLPSGQLIVLMADHQTTGGYPIIAYVTGADLPTLAQKRALEKINFQLVSVEEAEQALLQQEHQLQTLQLMVSH